MEDLNEVLKRIRIAGVAFIIVLITGTIGYYSIGEPGIVLVDCFYMTAITISTIGFHEVVDLSHHPYGRLFTIFIAFSGFGVLTYLLSNVMALFIEGGIRKTLKRRRMIKEIKKFKNHFIVCGCGRVGRNIALELFATERPMVLADAEEAPLEKLVHQVPGTPFVSGDCTEEAVLESLGIRSARGLFVVTGDDNINLVICLTARQVNPGIKIVVVSKNIHHAKKIEIAGANKVITPTFIGGLRMASEMLRPTVTLFLDEMMRSDFKQRLEEVLVTEKFNGKSIGELEIEKLDETIILALKTDEKWHYNPKTDHVVRTGNILIMMTTPEERRELEKNFA